MRRARFFRARGRLCRFVLHYDLLLFRLAFSFAIGWLGTAARALCQRGLDLLDRFGLGNALHSRDLARETIKRRFIELALRVGLLRLGVRAIEVADDLGNRDDIAGVDFGFVFLGAARPHRALDARASLERLERAPDQRSLRQL